MEKTLPQEHLNGFFTHVPEPQGSTKIRPVSMKSILQGCPITHYDLLSLDVEGHEYEVLMSWDFSIPIDIILIETLGGSQVEREEMCRQLILRNRYHFDCTVKQNEVFIHKDCRCKI